MLPKENSMLHYRIIGFSYPVKAGDPDCAIEVATGNCSNEETFGKNVIVTQKCKNGKAIIEVPSFGKEYTWRVFFESNTKTHKASILHHFSCMISGEVDTNVSRLVILEKAERYKDAYVFIDGLNALYDMNGNPVWYVPVTKELNPKKGKIWDMKLTQQGTITFLLDQNIYEINYGGDVLWKGPNNGKVSGDSIEYYHHELTKLSDGNYMVLGTEFVSWELPSTADGKPQIKSEQMTPAKEAAKERTAFGTIMAYDHDGNVVWSWKSSHYFKTVDPKFLKADLYDAKAKKKMVDVHENAFYFDEKEQVIYLSFKNISTILKIKYPEGDVLNVYGELAKNITGEGGNEQFCGQHSCKTTEGGYLLLYNNNACHENGLPQILMYEQQKVNDALLTKVWEYDCGLDDVVAEKEKEAKYSNDTNAIVSPEVVASLNVYSKGGNLVELPDHCIFASICGIYGKVFIVTPEKETIWSALPETWNQYRRKWEDVINYKANIIADPAKLAKAIWNIKNN